MASLGYPLWSPPNDYRSRLQRPQEAYFWREYPFAIFDKGIGTLALVEDGFIPIYETCRSCVGYTKDALSFNE